MINNRIGDWMIRSLNFSALFVCFAFAAFAAFVQAQAANVEVAAILKQNFESQNVETGSSRLTQRQAELKAFYESRSFKPIWVRDNGPKGKAKALLVELNRSVVHGLSPRYYRVDALEGLMSAKTPIELAKLELLFGGALIDYGHDLSNGHIGYDTAPNQVQISPIIRDITSVLDGAEKAGNLRTFISSLLNVDDRYVRLVTKIAEMKRADAAGLWPEISRETPALVLGQSHREIINIRTYLILLGDYLVAEFSKKTEFDEPLRQAILNFQSRQGIEMNGELDRQTIETISQSIPAVVEKISINLERRRWQNKPIGDTHIYINLADNQARLVKGGKKVEEFELLQQADYKQVPSLYGTVAKVGKSATGKGLKLVINASSPKDANSRKYTVITKGGFGKLSIALGVENDSTSSDNGLISLKNPVSIFVTYVTAWANKNGSIHFRPDKYQRDHSLKKLLLAD